jgi:hypothetical protein
VAEDLADADLGGPVGLVLVADHPERDHAAGVVQGLGPQLEQAVPGRVEAGVLLGLADDQVGLEA